MARDGGLCSTSQEGQTSLWKGFWQEPRTDKGKLAKGTNQKNWWQMTRDIAGLGKNKQSVTPEAQDLATFFTEKFHIPDEESAELPNLEDDDFEFELKTFRVKRNRVQRVLERLDSVSPRVLKRCATALSMPITRLFQKAWKVARITPIHKKGPTSSPSIYRPISVLPTLSTTLERKGHLIECGGVDYLLTCRQWASGAKHSSCSTVSSHSSSLWLSPMVKSPSSVRSDQVCPKEEYGHRCCSTC